VFAPGQKSVYPDMRIVFTLFLLLAASSARADVIYTYVGNPFADVVDLPFPPGTFDTSMKVTGSFELADALPADLPLTDISGDVLAFSFSNGRSTLTESDPNLLALFFVQTNASGEITVWDIILQQTLTLTPLGDHDTQVFTQNDPTGLLGISAVADRGALMMCDPPGVPRGICASLEDSATISDTPGLWSSSATPPPVPVPEPATVSLLTLALGAWVRRSR
jgi:hypothetical protein